VEADDNQMRNINKKETGNKKKVREDESVIKMDRQKKGRDERALQI